MTHPNGDGFAGFNAMQVSGTPVDYFAKADRPTAVTNFAGHFRNEGRRHTESLTGNLIIATLLGSNLSPLAESTSSFRPDTPAQHLYASGVRNQLTADAISLRMIVEARESGLHSTYIPSSMPHLAAVAGLPNDKCLALAEAMEVIVAKSANVAGSMREPGPHVMNSPAGRPLGLPTEGPVALRR
ncbi:hypothetical protein [Saccharothrix sp. ALI-22-I]|uniref:hypothetical protein n=1 Tax=Saccharothrix sp. ALI-22-I TaxID=1933778 RepID=UPI00117A8450|nr:hypothetical protein [Saccharothrix sp. ALI-22-I]